jgi:peptide/nickel transport system substrate-binding protein
VVDGPYKIQGGTPSQTWVIVPNKAFPGHKALDRIVFLYEGSNAAEFASLKVGTVQMGYLDTSEWGARNELTLDTRWIGYPFDDQDIELDMNKKAENGLGPVFS